MELRKLITANSDRVVAIVATIAGVIALGLGYVGTAGSVFPAAQIPYVISGGLGGIFLLGVAGTLWLSADLRDEWRKLDDLLDKVAEPDSAGVDHGWASAPWLPPAPPTTSNGAGVRVPGAVPRPPDAEVTAP